MFVVNFDKLVIRARSKMELTQEEFCAKYNIPLSTLKGWERETKNDTLETIFKHIGTQPELLNAILFDDDIMENIVNHMPLAQKNFFTGKEPDEESYTQIEVKRIVFKAVRQYINVLLEALAPKNV